MYLTNWTFLFKGVRQEVHFSSNKLLLAPSSFLIEGHVRNALYPSYKDVNRVLVLYIDVTLIGGFGFLCDTGGIEFSECLLVTKYI